MDYWTESEKLANCDSWFNQYYNFTFAKPSFVDSLIEKFDWKYEWVNNIREKQEGEDEESEGEDYEPKEKEKITYTIIRDHQLQAYLKSQKEVYLEIPELDLFIWGGHGWGYSFSLDKVLVDGFRESWFYRDFLIPKIKQCEEEQLKNQRK
jgi:hypothetical protein